MANESGVFGLRPVAMLGGTAYNGATRKAYISGNYATALFVGDIIILETTDANKESTGKYPTVIQWDQSSQTAIYGVIESFDPLPTDLSKNYNPASTERYCNILTDKNVVYQIRGDDDGTAPTKTAPGQNFNITAAPSGSTSTGLSGMSLDQSSGTTTPSLPLHCLSLANVENNELGDNAIYEVLINIGELVAGSRLGVTSS